MQSGKQAIMQSSEQGWDRPVCMFLDSLFAAGSALDPYGTP
jgi:hypothetical protein